MTVGEAVVGAGTLALAGATVWLAREARKARTEAEAEERQRLLRSALAEQLDNCRAWTNRDPGRGEPAVRALRGSQPRLVATRSLIDRLDLPPDLVAYLIWLMSAIRDLWDGIETFIDGLPEDWGRAPKTLVLGADDSVRIGDDWRVMVERLQVLAALTAAEARRRGFDEVARPHAVVPWTIPPERPPRWRELMALAGVPYGQPQFPADPAFASARPEARDRAGAETGASQMAFLAGRTHSGPGDGI